MNASQLISGGSNDASYGMEYDDGLVGLVPYGFNTDSDDSYELPSKSRIRRKRVQSSKCQWLSAKNKRLRENGNRYLGRKKHGDSWIYNNVKKQRAIKPRCNCKNVGTMKCSQVTDVQRKDIFEKFWQMDWSAKKMLVKTLIQTSVPVRIRNRKDDTKSRRSQSIKYQLKVENRFLRVCKNFFLNTFSIGYHTVLNWIKKPLVQSKENIQRNYGVQRQNLESFFDSLPLMESHYCRARTQKKYLLPEWSSKKMVYDFYVNDWCTKQCVKNLSITKFNEIFNIRNLGLFIPKKDQCEKCVRYSVGNLSLEEYLLHQEKKEDARTEKNRDKEKESHVYTVDLQAVLMAPKSQASSHYYRTKLQVHNLVFYNLKNKKTDCFIWNESEGGVSAEAFASIWGYFIEKQILRVKDHPEKIIIYSDGCTYQNRNYIMSNALLNTAIKHKVIIEKKILEPGHTQMEVDSVHSAIERSLKNKNIDVPADYIGICKSARKIPEAYNVSYLSHDFFKTFSNVQFCKNIRPGRGKGDAKVTDIRGLKYIPNGDICYKLRFNDNWRLLPQRIDRQVIALEWSNLKQLHQERIKITAKKFEDLQYLKSTLPKDHHHFYDNIPHE